MKLYSAILSYLRPYFLILNSCHLLIGCVPYKFPAESYVRYSNNTLVEYREHAARHWLYTIIPRHRCQIRWYDLPHWTTWALFGNDDDGIFGENAKIPYKYHRCVSFHKALLWAARNPFHNLCYYVIGSAHKPNSQFILMSLCRHQQQFFRYNAQGHTVFNCSSGGFYCGLHGWKPFMSLFLSYSEARVGKFYLGWRERGNFGIKIVPWTKRKKINP